MIALAVGFGAGAAFTEGALAKRSEELGRREHLADQLANDAVHALDQARALCTTSAIATRPEPR
ncbi:MAG: hypothetical protein KDH15_12160 [Rhodocyclaceae bacterium]|nr:hypothetical protein [Rhodocyclaceae bacterium]